MAMSLNDGCLETGMSRRVVVFMLGLVTQGREVCIKAPLLATSGLTPCTVLNLMDCTVSTISCQPLMNRGLLGTFVGN